MPRNNHSNWLSVANAAPPESMHAQRSFRDSGSHKVKPNVARCRSSGTWRFASTIKAQRQERSTQERSSGVTTAVQLFSKSSHEWWNGSYLEYGNARESRSFAERAQFLSWHRGRAVGRVACMCIAIWGVKGQNDHTTSADAPTTRVPHASANAAVPVVQYPH
jgi:hypothetical protein